MSDIGLRFTPPDESYHGFKFRMASMLCMVFGFFTAVFLVKHTLVFRSDHTVGLLPEPFQAIRSYLLAYYSGTLSGRLEFVVMLAIFAAVFWLNLPKHYFAGRYRDYAKESVSPEAKSLTLLIILAALSFVTVSVPFFTLHFPAWLSWLIKYGPIVAGVLQYLSVLPEMKQTQRMSAIDKLDWDVRSFDATHRSRPNKAVEKELVACSTLMSGSDSAAARRFLTQGSATVTWSGIDALFNNLENLLGISAESMSLYRSASQAIEFSLGELLDARGAEPTLVLTTDAEHPSLQTVLSDRLQPTYRFRIETVALQNLIWSNAPATDIVAAILSVLVEKKPHIAVLSHVFPDSGIVLDLKKVIDAAHENNPGTLFVIDGSQAIGNIMVGDETFFRSAYYAFHSHGWLLGTPSVGILVRNGWLLRVARQQTAPRPFSRAYYAGSLDSPAAADTYLPWFALNYVLKHEWLEVRMENATSHTGKLASLFREEIHKRDIRTVGISGASSAVVITGIADCERLYRMVASKGLDCRKVSGVLGNGEQVLGIRFCFHHYHSEEDVGDLACLIANLKAEIDSARPEQADGVAATRRAYRQSA